MSKPAGEIPRDELDRVRPRSKLDEKKALQFAGKVFLELPAEALSKALQSAALLEVHCEQDH